jgi:hypothetical protein
MLKATGKAVSEAHRTPSISQRRRAIESELAAMPEGARDARRRGAAGRALAAMMRLHDQEVVPALLSFAL